MSARRKVERELELSIECVTATKNSTAPAVPTFSWRHPGRKDSADDLRNIIAHLDKALALAPGMHIVDVHERMLFNERILGVSRAVHITGATRWAPSCAAAAGTAAACVLSPPCCIRLRRGNRSHCGAGRRGAKPTCH